MKRVVVAVVLVSPTTARAEPHTELYSALAVQGGVVLESDGDRRRVGGVRAAIGARWERGAWNVRIGGVLDVLGGDHLGGWLGIEVEAARALTATVDLGLRGSASAGSSTLLAVGPRVHIGGYDLGVDVEYLPDRDEYVTQTNVLFVAGGTLTGRRGKIAAAVVTVLSVAAAVAVVSLFQGADVDPLP